MEIEKEFELEEFEFDSKSKFMGIVPVRRYYATLEGDGMWSVENDSFDYAGTHCTWGQSGTHHLPDYARVDDFSLSQVHVFFEIYDRDMGAWFEAERKFLWKYKRDRAFIKRFESDYREEIMQMLQEQEEQDESVIKSLSEY